MEVSVFTQTVLTTWNCVNAQWDLATSSCATHVFYQPQPKYLNIFGTIEVAQILQPHPRRGLEASHEYVCAIWHFCYDEVLHDFLHLPPVQILTMPIRFVERLTSKDHGGRPEKMFCPTLVAIIALLRNLAQVLPILHHCFFPSIHGENYGWSSS